MDKQFVSRGGIKLQSALDQFKLNITSYIVLDVGSSTGGFVDCLLQNQAQKVFALDTSYGELAWKLRNDQRVVVLERTNILHLTSLPEKVDLVTIDAGWTKLEKILPILKPFLKPTSQIIALIKPQYQIDSKKLVKGVVPDQLVESVKDQVIQNINDLDFKVEKTIDSPILGGGGNKEYLSLITLSS